MNYDLLVIGGGPGGYVAAIRAAQLGMKVALCEKRELGGTCLNRGCVPTKALLHAASLRTSFGEMRRWGIDAPEIAPAFDLSAMYAQKDTVVAQLRDGVAALLKGNGVAVYSGTAQIAAPGSVTVQGVEGSTALSAPNILIATGSEPVRLPLPGFDAPGMTDSDGLLALEKLPRGLLIVGGGVIGVEFAFLFSRLGVPVQVVEAMPQLLPGVEPEIVQNLAVLLRKAGVQTATGARVLSAETRADGLAVRYEQKGAEKEALCDTVLVAVGRRPHSAGLFAPGMTPPQGERGAVTADAQGRTSIPGIWAIGDVCGGTQLAHYASAMGIRAVEAIAGLDAHALSPIPACIYTEPEIATVGLTESAAKAQGLRVSIQKTTLNANARQIIEGAPRSLIKLVMDQDKGILLGAHLMTPRASDMIGFYAAAIAQGTRVEELADVIQPHPSFAESGHDALEALLGNR